MNPMIAIALLLFFLSCKTDPIIDYETAFNNCPIDTIRSYGGQGTMEYYSKSYKGLLGAQLPDFTAKTIEGKEISKTYFQGKVSIINFWFIGCHPCEDEMPVFNQLVEKYKDRSVNFLALSRNSPEDVQEFLVTNPFNVDHIAYADPFIVGIFHAAWGYPITMVADQNMKIIHIALGLGTVDQVTESQKEFIAVIDNALAGK